MIDEERLAADEYEKQFYGFSSTELCEDFQEEVCKVVGDAVEEAASFLLAEYENKKISEDAEASLGERKRKLYSAFMESAQISLELFKVEARKIFAIPENVLLEEDKYKSKEYSDEDIFKLKKEVAELEEELLKEQVFLEKCKQQKKLIDDVVKPTYDKVNSILACAKKIPTKDSFKISQNKLTKLHEERVQFYFSNTNNVGDKTQIAKVHHIVGAKSTDESSIVKI